jgi:hypothetical protein
MPTDAEIRAVAGDEPRPSQEEQADVLRRTLAFGYRDVAAAEDGRAHGGEG